MATASIWQRFTVLLLLLVLFALLAVIGMLAAGVRGGPLDPPGAPGETDSVRLPGTPIDGPTEITQPGHYYLTRNITIPAQGIGVQISADNVTLDLGGFTIVGDPGSDDVGISVGENHVRIFNGIINRAETGVDAPVEDVSISGVAVYNASAGFVLGQGGVLEECISTGNLTGVEINGRNAIVRGCVIRENETSGVVVNGSANGALIERSVIRDNNLTAFAGEAGIHLFINADQATIRENDLGFNGVADIAVGGADTVIIDNTLDCPTSIVLDGSSSNTFAPVNSSDPHTNRAHKVTC